MKKTIFFVVCCFLFTILSYFFIYNTSEHAITSRNLSTQQIYEVVSHTVTESDISGAVVTIEDSNIQDTDVVFSQFQYAPDLVNMISSKAENGDLRIQCTSSPDLGDIIQYVVYRDSAAQKKYKRE